MKDQIDGLNSELERTNELIRKFAGKIESLEVNGVRYVSKKQPKHDPLFASLFPKSVNTYFDKWDGKDIIEEYQLIQKKQSKLPRAKRDWIVNKFHKHFQELPETFVKYLGQPLQA